MNYIIDPRFFYILSICDGLKEVLSTIAIIIGILVCTGAVVFGIMYYVNSEYGDDDPELKNAKTMLKHVKNLAIIAAIIGVLWVFCPSKDTLIEMQIARFATYDNAQAAIEVVKSATDYVINAIQEVK